MQTFIRAFDTNLAPSVATLMAGTFTASGIVEYYRPVDNGNGYAY